VGPVPELKLEVEVVWVSEVQREYDEEEVEEGWRGRGEGSVPLGIVGRRE
jgi:hypothetical protein